MSHATTLVDRSAFLSPLLIIRTTDCVLKIESDVTPLSAATRAPAAPLPEQDLLYLHDSIVNTRVRGIASTQDPGRIKLFEENTLK